MDMKAIMQPVPSIGRSHEGYYINFGRKIKHK